MASSWNRWPGSTRNATSTALAVPGLVRRVFPVRMFEIVDLVTPTNWASSEPDRSARRMAASSRARDLSLTSTGQR